MKKSAKEGYKSMKKSISKRIEQIDDQKKVNPLDLSSDQDLTVALMNLIAVEDMVNAGALGDMVRDVREKLMRPIVRDMDNAEMLRDLLGGAMRMMQDGCDLLANGKQSAAYDAFNRSYELYSVFWGLNMGMVDKKTIQKWI